MTPSELEAFRALLTDQLSRLLSQAQQAASELATYDNRTTEYVDRASEDTNQEMKLRIKSRESRLIKKVRMALDRIENGSYGLCELCGEPIALPRLTARPVTTKCIQCKEAEERMEAMSW